MTTLILVRHAQSAPDPALPERAWPLSDKGRQQALDLAPALAELGVDALASSPYLCAIETLRPYAERAGLEISIDEDLRERALGGWLPDVADVEKAIRSMHADLDFQLEGGESGRACVARFDAALARVVEAHPGPDHRGRLALRGAGASDRPPERGAAGSVLDADQEPPPVRVRRLRWPALD